MTENESIDSGEIDLRELLQAIWRSKLLIAVCALLGVALGVFTVANTFPTFEANALVQLEERSGRMAVPAALQALTDTAPQTEAEIEIIMSRLVLRSAVAEMNLDWQVSASYAPVIGVMMARYPLPIPDFKVLQPFARRGESVELSLLSVPERWINSPMRLTINEGGYTIELPNGESIAARTGETVTRDDLEFAITVSKISAPAGRLYTVEHVDEGRAILGVRSSLRIAERGRDTSILELLYTGGDVSLNVHVLNAIIEAYVQQNVARVAAEAQSSLEFIKSQLPEAERALDAAETALNQYRAQQGTVDLTFETENILTQINAVEAQLAELRRREDEISQRYTSSHPIYRQLQDERARLETQMEDLRWRAGGLPDTQREMLNLTRDLELAQGIYTELLTRRQEVEVLRASKVGNVRVIDSAEASRGRVAPRSSMIVLLSMILGIMAGVALALLRNSLRKGIQSGSELEAMGLPVFATINYSAKADTAGRRRGKLEIIALTDPADLSVEAYRSMRTSLHFGMLDAQNRALAITSAHPGAGKSYSAVNFAVTAAKAGQRVCLIDADMRRGYLRRYFGMGPGRGLADILAGDAEVEQILFQGPIDNLMFIPAGNYPPNPSELLMRPAFGSLIAKLDTQFDLIVLDTPPVLAVTDPVLIAQKVGTTILVARHDQTVLGEIEAALKTFAAGGQKLAGAILNGFDPKKAKVGDSYGYRYSYQ